jgi:hypothetical protein
VPSTPPPAYNPEDPSKFAADEPSAPPQHLVETQGNATGKNGGIKTKFKIKQY